MSHDYNFAAADRLERELNQLISRLDTLIQFRSAQRNALLGTSDSNNWQGGKRHDNDTKYRRQQSAFQGMKERARRLQQHVAAATAAARKAEKPESGGATPTPRPGTSPTPR